MSRFLKNPDPKMLQTRDPKVPRNFVPAGPISYRKFTEVRGRVARPSNKKSQDRATGRKVTKEKRLP